MRKIALFIVLILFSIGFSFGCAGNPSNSTSDVGSLPNQSEDSGLENDSNSSSKDDFTGEEDKFLEIISDADFNDGFGILGLNSSLDGSTPKSYIKFGRKDPIWRIGQWGSRFNLNEPTVKTVTQDKMQLSDGAKSVVLDRKTGEMTLSLDATKEYDEMADSRVMWSHLLIEQEYVDFRNKYFLDEFSSLTATIDFTMTELVKGEIETKPTSETLPVQFLQYFYVVNYNRQSEGYGSFLWFGLNYFDSRYTITTTSYLQDYAGGNAGNYIYTVGMDEISGDEAFEVGKEYNISIELLPHIEIALKNASEHGFMMNTQLSDCTLTGMNLGYEIPGAWKSTVKFDNLSLMGTFKD